MSPPTPAWPGRVALWTYRHIRRTGLLSIPPVRRAHELAYSRYKRYIEDPFYNLTRLHPELFRGGHVIDAGANIGYTAGVFAGAIDPGYRVWAFEPSSENFDLLRRSIDNRRLHGVIIARRAAVGDRVGTIDLILNPGHPGDHHVAPLDDRADTRESHDGVERVPVTTIDEEVRAHAVAPVAFIKIDVQGYELHVCRGMSETLDANRGAAVVLEYAPDTMQQYGVEPEELSQFFAQRGYSGYRVAQRGRLEAVNVLDLPKDLPPPGYINILFTRAAQDADPS